MITLLLDPSVFGAETAEVTGDAYRHLFRARRLAVGERLRAVDGAGRARWAEVAAVRKDSARLVLGESAPTFEPAVAVTLLVAALRPERASWLVEKATELGAAAVRFVASERTPRDYGGAALARLGRVAAAALEQCHGARLPELSGVHPWKEVPALVEAAAGEDGRLLLDTTAGALPASALLSQPLRLPLRSALLVGPEGGWSDTERLQLAGLGARPLSLGERTLRVETAAAVGLGLLLSAGGVPPTFDSPGCAV